MIYVKPDGPKPCRYVIAGEAPAREEVAQGRGFVGPSGRLLWPLLWRLAGLERPQCYVTNLCKHPLDNDVSGEEKLEDAEFERWAALLREEVRSVRPEVVLAVGALAAKGLLGDEFTDMATCNGMGFRSADGYVVVPTWHPAAALRGGGEDALAYTGDAIANMRVPRMPHRVSVPQWRRLVSVASGGLVAIDTEGLPSDPLMLTWSDGVGRYVVDPADVPTFWQSLQRSGATALYHNAPWDWAVIKAMGVADPTAVPYLDTMELAYIRQVEPRGLKALAYRHYRLRMREWEEVVYPHYFSAAVAEAQRRVDAGTSLVRRFAKQKKDGSPGRELKAAVELTDEAKALKRTVNNGALAAKRLQWWDGEKGIDAGGTRPPSLRFVPEAEALEYASLDPFATYKVWEALR